MKVLVTPGINTGRMNEIISLNQGSGGRHTHRLIKEVFVKSFGIVEPLTDSALTDNAGITLAFTTDSYVVDPVFFPGGNIGKLAVCGTVNDIAVSGAIPKYIAAAFIIEEGFPLADLVKITESMAEEAEKAGVRIVTGDTKVVEKGKCDKIFITTSGTGILRNGRRHISTGEHIKPGDKIFINGPVGNHALAVLGARKNLSFRTPVVSDCASLNTLIKSIMTSSEEILFMRDLTRGGLGTVLNELAGMIGSGIEINEVSIPVDDPVKGLCEMLGFDPLYLANEGKVLVVTGNGEEKRVLEAMRADPHGGQSQIIGQIKENSRKMVILNTFAGGKRILEMPSGLQLPRIC
jgi:hydrogenase expression/formation protein HypE